MQSYKASKRMKDIVEQAKKLNIRFHKMADIGTDHGYLPRLMFDENLVESSILCDVNPGPLKNAEKTFVGTNNTHTVDFRLGSGIEPLSSGEVDLVVIAGMGGGLILDILSKEIIKSKSFPYMILQPQTEQNLLRQWLIDHQFTILWEHYLIDMGKHYEMLVVQTSKNTLEHSVDDASKTTEMITIAIDSDDLEFGTVILKDEIEAYLNFLQYKSSKYTLILEHIQHAQDSEEKRELCNSKLETIKQIQNRLKTGIT